MTIDAFQDKVMQLRPNNFMGMGGAGAGIVGATDGGAAAMLQLHRACIDFVRAYNTGDSIDSLKAAKKELIAKIMVAHTLDTISESQADELIDAAQSLVSEKDTK